MSYHTCLKEAVRNGTLPEKYRKTIPRSTQWRWKNENPDKYIGSELCQDKHDLQTLLQLVEKYPALFFAYGRLVKVVLDIVATTQNFPALLRSHKDTVVNTVLHVKDTLGLTKALKIFRLSRSTFDRWLLQIKAECVHNYLNLCTQRMPQQLTRHETDTMRKLLGDPKFSHWGIASLAYYAIRKNLVMASPATWYKYNQLLGIRKRGRKRENRTAEAAPLFRIAGYPA